MDWHLPARFGDWVLGNICGAVLAVVAIWIWEALR